MSRADWLQRIPRRPQSWGLIAAALVLGAVFWWQFLAAQSDARRHEVAEIAHRASQVADAVALQADTLVSGIDVALQHLSAQFLDQTPQAFAGSVRATIAAFPEGAIAQIGLTDAAGVLVLSNLGFTGRVDLSDREHIRVHLGGKTPGMFVSEPVLGRVSRQWTVQFSRAVFDRGHLVGVVVVSVPTRYLADTLARVAMSSGDTINLVRTDGRWIARTSELERAMTLRMSLDRPYFTRAQARGEIYRAASPVDGSTRITAWRRLQNANAVVVVGMDERTNLAELVASQRSVAVANAIGSVVSFTLVLIVAFLLESLYRSRER